MSREALGTYLNDHLAGSVAAVELVERAIEDNAGTALGSFLAELGGAIREDQETLRRLIERLEFSESSIRKAGAWLLGKAERLKSADAGGEPLHRLELLEVLGLGIQGKLKLWRALQRIGSRYPALSAVDFTALERRAREQHEAVEAHRLEAALAALGA
jgi:hypothetical protein